MNNSLCCWWAFLSVTYPIAVIADRWCQISSKENNINTRAMWHCSKLERHSNGVHGATENVAPEALTRAPPPQKKKIRQMSTITELIRALLRPSDRLSIVQHFILHNSLATTALEGWRGLSTGVTGFPTRVTGFKWALNWPLRMWVCNFDQNGAIFPRCYYGVIHWVSHRYDNAAYNKIFGYDM